MSFSLPRSIADSNFAISTHLDENFAAIETELDGSLDDDNINPSAAIDASKIGNGGAVTQGEVTTTGEANKIPKMDADANIVASGIIFKDGV